MSRGGRTVVIPQTVVDANSEYSLRIPLRPLTGPVPARSLRRISTYGAIYATVLALLGIGTILYCIFFGYQIDLFIGWLLIVSGVITVLHGITLWGAPGTLATVANGLIQVFFGAVFVMPWLTLEGKVALSAFLPFLFLASGLARVGQAGSLHRIVMWPFLLISGVIAIVLAIVVWGAYPALPQRTLGIVVGADFVAFSLALGLVSGMSNIGYKVMAPLEEEDPSHS